MSDDKKVRFQSRFLGFVTYAGPTKVKFNKGFYDTDKPAIIKHLNEDPGCKGVVTRVMTAEEAEAIKAAEAARIEKMIADRAAEQVKEAKEAQKAAEKSQKEAESKQAEAEAALKKAKDEATKAAIKAAKK